MTLQPRPRDRNAPAPTRRPPAARRTRTRRRRITADDLLRLCSVAHPRISPDGARIVFVHKHVGDKNEALTNLWMADAQGARPFTSGNRDGQPEWSPDGTRIAFVSRRDRHRPQIALIPVDGGEAVDLTDLPEGDVGRFQWSPDGTRLAVAFRERAAEWTQAAREQREQDGRCDPPRVIDDPWYRLDGDGYFDAQRFRLLLVDAESGAHRVVYDQDRLGAFHFDFSPDGRSLALITNRDKQAYAKGWTTELLRLDIASGRIKTFPKVPPGPKDAVAWSPDGKRIAWAGTEDDDGTREGHNLRLWLTDAKTGATRCLTRRDDMCLRAPTLSDTTEVEFGAHFRWAPDGRRLWVQIGWHGESHVASVPARGGTLSMHTRGHKQHALGNLSADGRRMALTVESALRPADVHVAEVGAKANAPLETRALTDVNRELLRELDLARPSARWVRSADGTRVHTWVMLPPGASTRTRRPAILEIHGGPHAQYGWSFFHEFQLLAAQGYVVVYTNPRGSKGYGQAHCDGNTGCWGTTDWQDLEAVTEEMRSMPFVDPARMGVMGGSFGGYMTLWAIGHTRAFRAAISDRCVSNMVSMWSSSDIMLWPDTYFPGNGWDDTEALWEMSPLKHLGKAKTPTLLIHSEGDLRCNIAESEQAYVTLSLRNVPTRFVRYPRNTSHGMSRNGPPDMRIHRLGQILAWWKRWLKPRR